MRLTVSTAVSACLVLIGGAAGAQVPKDNIAKHCSGLLYETSDRRVQICGTIIDDASRSAQARAFGYANRAGAYYELRKLDLALADATKAVELWPEYQQGHVIRGTVLGDMGRNKDALQDLDKAIATGGGYAGYLARGHVLLSVGNYRAAATDLEQAVKLFPTASALMWRGYAYNGLGLYDRAEKDLTQVIRDAPDEPRAWIGRAETLLALGKREGAAADVEHAASLSKTPGQPGEADAKVWIDLGHNLSRRDDYSNALAAYDEAVAHFPSPQAYNDRCWLRATAGRDLPLARADCDRALELSPENPAVLDSRGLVRFRAGDFPGAIDDLDAVLRLRPQSADSLFVRGLAKKRLGSSVEGDADISAAVAMRANVAQQYAHYGIAQ